MNCEKCGVSGENEQIYDVVCKDKLVRMCKRCADFEDLLIIKKSDLGFNTAQERPQSVYERMVHISGVKRDLSNAEKNRLSAKDLVLKKEPTMRDIVERNLSSGRLPVIQQNIDKRPGIANNHHWIVMRARRSRKITQEQLAELVNVPVSIIAGIERGKMPDDLGVFRRIENALKIKIFIGPESERESFVRSMDEPKMVFSQTIKDKPIVFDAKVMEELKIGEIKNIEANLDDSEKASYWGKFRGVFKKQTEDYDSKSAGETKIEERIEKENSKEIKENSPGDFSKEPETEKKSFFERFFLRKKQEVQEILPDSKPVDSVSEEIEEKPSLEKKKYRQPQTPAMSKRDLSSKEINELIFGKKEEKK